MRNREPFSLSVLLGTVLILTVIELAGISFFANTALNITLVVLANLLIATALIFQNQNYVIKRRKLISEINDASSDSLNTALSQLPMGLIRFEAGSRRPEWYNHFVELIYPDKAPGKADVEELLQLAYSKSPLIMGERRYTVEFDGKRNLIYVVDTTAELNAKTTLADRRPVIGTIAVDNYTDAVDAFSEGERSTLNSFIVNFLDNFAREQRLYLRRLASDRYIFFTNYRTLSELIASKFSILETFRAESTERKTPLALSIGISYGVNDFSAIGKTAVDNLELALVRGGDQAVLKENTDQAKVTYFGGNSESRVAKSRTRARAIATALKTIVSESDKVFIVGHKNTDMDALGAAITMKNFATMIGKEAFVVYQPENLTTDVMRAVDKLNQKGEDLYQHIVQLDEAKKQKTENSLLIMVDHSKISQTLDEAFYESFAKLVVIDHHRRDENFPKQAMLSYIESGASSATEMAVEILQFLDTSKRKMTAIEASVALAGISMDTKSFTKATTPKTFEAASYLREQGADNELVQNLLATDFSEYKKVNAIVLAAELLDGGVALAMGPDDESYDSMTIAKAADELLAMAGITASFVLGKGKTGQILVSARSRGFLNVQTLMEAMGGGGHFDTAATQVADKTMAAVKAELLALLTERLVEIEVK